MHTLCPVGMLVLGSPADAALLLPVSDDPPGSGGGGGANCPGGSVRWIATDITRSPELKT